jgi:hypothetical protein
MNVENNLSMPVQQMATPEPSAKEKSNLFYTSEGYQRILDYRVSEIILTTIIFGVILFVRLHR